MLRDVCANASLTLRQKFEQEQNLYCHQSLPTAPGRDGDSERVKEPAGNTRSDLHT